MLPVAIPKRTLVVAWQLSWLEEAPSGAAWCGLQQSPAPTQVRKLVLAHVARLALRQSRPKETQRTQPHDDPRHRHEVSQRLQCQSCDRRRGQNLSLKDSPSKPSTARTTPDP